jgi:adenosylcobinamide-GDP ribazoletransferase
MSAFWLALSFLTRLPVPTRFAVTPVHSGQAVLCYPLVGLLIGILLVSARTALAAHPMLGSALILALWAGITGGLHLDGLADCADAWIGGQGDRERSLLIMKDPRCGPAAITALMTTLLVKYGALVELGTDPHAALLWAPVLGRAAVAFWLLNLPYVRAQGLGSALVEYLPRRGAGAVLTLTAILAGIALGLPLLLWTAGAAWGLAVIMRRWLGGWTGDTLGAGIELVEVAVLAGAVMIGP